MKSNHNRISTEFYDSRFVHFKSSDAINPIGNRKSEKPHFDISICKNSDAMKFKSQIIKLVKE